MFHQPSVVHPVGSWYPMATPMRLDVVLQSFRSASADGASATLLTTAAAA
jgi:hypothetical protein